MQSILSLIAAALRLLAHGAAILRLFNPRPLLWAAWQIAHEAPDAVGVISLTAGQFGMRAANELARQMFAKIPDCQIYTTLAWIEITQHGDFQTADKWLKTADEQGTVNRHVLYALKLYLSDHLDSYDKMAIIEEMLGRNDLPGEYTRDALLGKAAILFKQKNWSQADQIAERILQIEDNPHALWVKWVAAAAGNDDVEAQKLLQELLAGGQPGQIHCMIALGWQYIGNRRQAMLALHEADKYNVNIELFDKDLAELTKTAEYYNMDNQHK